MVITTMRIVLRLAPLLLVLGGCAETWTCPEGTGRPERAGGGFADDCVPLGDMDAGGVDTGTTDGGPCEPCSGSTSVCDESSGDCVQCTADDDSACADDERCEANRCIQCADSGECTAPNAAHCSDTGRCVGCEGPGDCASVTDLPACNAESVCVPCTVDDADDCATGVCTIDEECSAYGATQELCQPCDTDENCAGDNWGCAPMEYEMMARPGGYCLPIDGSPDCGSPFVTVDTRRSLSGVEGTRFCVFEENVLTCEAVDAFLSRTPCAGNDANCPGPGICRDIGTMDDLCTFPCTDPSQCDTGFPFSVCDDGGTGGVDYCGGDPP